MIYCFDLDNTLCFTEGNDYGHARPNYEAIQKVNNLYDKGNTIKIFTGRGSISGIKWKGYTHWQLLEWGLKFHELDVGDKPTYDIYIDDKAYNAKDWLHDNIPDTA